MLILIISLIIIISILLILVVLAQNSKGGVSSEFGGSATSQVMGVKKTGDLLERLTWGFAIALVVLTLSTYALREKSTVNDTATSPNIETAQDAVGTGVGVPSLDEPDPSADIQGDSVE